MLQVQNRLATFQTVYDCLLNRKVVGYFMMESPLPVFGFRKYLDTCNYTQPIYLEGLIKAILMINPSFNVNSTFNT